MSDLLVLFIHFYEGVSSDFGASAEGVMMLPSGPFVAGGCGAMIGACSTGLGADELASKMTAELPRPCERLNLLFSAVVQRPHHLQLLLHWLRH